MGGRICRVAWLGIRSPSRTTPSVTPAGATPAHGLVGATPARRGGAPGRHAGARPPAHRRGTLPSALSRAGAAAALACGEIRVRARSRSPLAAQGKGPARPVAQLARGAGLSSSCSNCSVGRCGGNRGDGRGVGVLGAVLSFRCSGCGTRSSTAATTSAQGIRISRHIRRLAGGGSLDPASTKKRWREAGGAVRSAVGGRRR
jgi:hypothetical protein